MPRLAETGSYVTMPARSEARTLYAWRYCRTFAGSILPVGPSAAGLSRPCQGCHNSTAVTIPRTTAGVEDVGVHTLRHSAAVAWLESGVHIKAVADLLGHSSIAVTGDIYGHTSDDTARAAVNGLSASLGL